MKKLSKKFEVEECDLFKFKGRIYTEQPRLTQVKYYLFNEDDNSYVAVLKRDSIVFLTVLLLITAISLGVIVSTVEPREHIVTISDTVYASDGKVGLNAANIDTNDVDIYLQLLTKDGVELTDTVKLQPGQSVGYVNLLTDVGIGSKMCELSYTIKVKSIPVVKKFDVLLVVEEDVQKGITE